ncbi:membrane protein [Mycobacterium holsaticum DSM 44478]|nr:membrane protein [Mycolicibacterium holsaticum DSM 44478 = JCM 12374]
MFGCSKSVNSTAYARYVGRVGALAVALGVGVAVATGGSGLAWADTGSLGDSQSSGASSGDGSDSSSGQAAGGNSAATQTESGSVDDALDGDDAGLDSDADDAADAEQSTDATLPTDDDEYEDYGEPDGLDEPETDDDTDVGIDDQDSTAATVEPESIVTQRDSALQGSPSNDVDQVSERIDDMASVAEPVDDPHASELTEQEQPAESSTSRLTTETLLDESVEVATILVEDEPTATPADTSSDVVGIASTVMAALLSPFVAPGPGAPAEPPLAWALLGWVRREWQHMFLNRTPTPVVDDITTSEDTPITVDVVTGTDPDSVAGDVVTVTEVTQPQNGSVTYEGGTLTYTPNADFHGTDTFTYTISDEESPLHVHGLRGLWAALFGGDAGHASTVTVTVTVNPVNDAPVAVDDSVTVAEDSGATVIDVLGNDTDLDGDDLSVIAVGSAANGAATLTDGVITYTPNADFYGTDSFSYSISDGMGGTATATVTVTVTAEPDPPAPADDTYTTDEDTPLNIPAPGVLGNDVDVDGDDLSVQLAQLPLHGIVSLNEDGSFTYTPISDFHGVDSFIYTVIDGNGGTATATVYVTVNPVNDAPVAVDDAVTVDEDGVAVVDVLANDTDVDGDELTVTTVGSASNGTVTLADGVITYTPDADFQGADSFTYTITDPDGETSTATVHVTVNPVNDDPVAVDDFVTVDEDTGATVVDVLGNDADVEDDELTVTGVGAATNGTVMFTDGVITYTPGADFQGADSFTYTVSDGKGGTATATVYVTVNPVNDAPVAVPDVVTVDENSTANVIDVLGNDTDVDGDALTVIHVGSAHRGTVTMIDGVITYTPDADRYGMDSFSYTITDGNGETSTALVRVEIISLNTTPVGNDDEAFTEENTPVVIDVLANDFDPDPEDVLRPVVFVAPNFGNAVVNDDGTITYTPSPGFHGTDTFYYRVNDRRSTSDLTAVTITVHQAPLVANDDDVVTDEDTPVLIDVLANDSDPTGDTITGIAIEYDGDGAIDLRDPERFTFTYIPRPDFFGTDTITYYLRDADGRVSNVGTVTITVNPVNDGPVASDDIVTVRTNSGPTVVNVLGNDSDVDGDDLSVIEVGTANNGTVTLSDGVITYTPVTGFVGSDSFTYAVTDGNGGVATATVRVTVNDPPVANDDVVSTEQNRPVLIDVLGNDTDVDGDVLRVIALGSPTNGSVTLDGGLVVYTPNSGFVGTDSFTYRVDDGTDVSETATVHIEVRERPFLAYDDFAVTDEDTPVEIHLVGNDLASADMIARIRVASPTEGSIETVAAPHTVRYTPPPDFVGTVTFTYFLVDSEGRQSNTATVTILVNPVNDNPVAVDDTATVDGDSGDNEIDVLANDFDVDGDVLTVLEVAEASNGSVALTDGVVTYRPNAGFVGTDSFTYTVADGNGGTGSATVTIKVKDPNTITFDDGARPSETFVSHDPTRIYVLTDNDLRIVDTRTGRIDIVDLDATPWSLVVSDRGDYAYVGKSADESETTAVTKIDLRTGAATPIGAVRQASAMAVSRDGEMLYVTDYQDGTVSVIDTATGEFRRIVTPLQGSAIAVSEDDSTLYVGLINNEVLAVDIETGDSAVVYAGAWDAASVADLSIAVTRDFAYVTDGLNNTVAVINTYDDEIYDVYQVGARPTSVAASPYGDMVLVASATEDKVTVISLELGVVGAFEVDGLVDVDFARNSQEVYVTTRDGISVMPTDHIYSLIGVNPL